MTKSKLIIDLTINNITLEHALERLLVISYNLKNDKLKTWILNELNGYNAESDLPEYRKIRSYNVIYSGINGNFKVENVPLPMTFIPSDIKHIFLEYNMNESIGLIEKNSNIENNSLGVDLTSFAHEIYNSSGVQCYSITKKLDSSLFTEILRKVKTKVLQFLLDLEATFDNLDNLDINMEDKSVLEINDFNESINQLFSEGKSLDD